MLKGKNILMPYYLKMHCLIHPCAFISQYLHALICNNKLTGISCYLTFQLFRFSELNYTNSEISLFTGFNVKNY